MPRRFVDYLPGSAIPPAHMPKKHPLSHVPPQPDEHPPSEHSDDGSSFVDQPPADPFETEPDSMGLFRIYPTHPTLFPSDDSNLISLIDGRAGALLASATSDSGGADEDDEEGDVALMRKQFAIRSSNTPGALTSVSQRPPALHSAPNTSIVPNASVSASPSNHPPRAPHPQRMVPSRKAPSPLTDTPSESRTPMSRPPRKAHPPPPDTPSREPTPATPAPRSKKAKMIVSESPLTAEESEEELEPKVRRPPRKVQNNRAANNVAASKAKPIALKKRKGKF
jgi:hypothetical protein